MSIKASVLEQQPAWIEENDQSIELSRRVKSPPTQLGGGPLFQKLFEAVIGKWVRGAICPLLSKPGWSLLPGESGLAKFSAAGSRGERVAIFTSGGPSQLPCRVLCSFSGEALYKRVGCRGTLLWSDFSTPRSDFTLSGFNSHGHISDPAMLTYR